MLEPMGAVDAVGGIGVGVEVGSIRVGVSVDGIRVGVKVSVGGMIVCVEVGSGIAAGALHPTTNPMINVSPKNDSNNFSWLMLISILGGSKPSRSTIAYTDS